VSVQELILFYQWCQLDFVDEGRKQRKTIAIKALRYFKKIWAWLSFTGLLLKNGMEFLMILLANLNGPDRIVLILWM